MHDSLWQVSRCVCVYLSVCTLKVNMMYNSDSYTDCRWAVATNGTFHWRHAFFKVLTVFDY